jgi:mannose/fructose-specific phosphotransferase system component IIA
MTRVLVISHGRLAEGFADAVRMIMGPQPGQSFVSLEEGEGPESFRSKLDAVLAEAGEEGVLILADLFGGTPSNQASLVYLESLSRAGQAPGGHGPVEILAGVNLAMLLEAAANREEMAPAELAAHLIEISPSTVIDVGRVLKERCNSAAREEGPR